MKKLLTLAALAGLAAVAYVAYQQFNSRQAEQDLWTEATSMPDLR
ncbi:MAG: DLW-39 family protein [Actinomycetes bacterium]